MTRDEAKTIVTGVDALRMDMATDLEQGRVTLALLRELIALLAPKEDGRASLDELLAAMITLLREINDKADEAIAGIRRLEGHGGNGLSGRPQNGAAHA